MMSGKKSIRKNVKNFNVLIKRIADKDKDSFETLYNIYGQMIYITAKTVVKSSFKADEVVNDVLLKIWQISPSLKKIKNPEGWLYLITVNCAKDKIKYEKSYEEIFEIAITDNQVDNILDNDEFFNDIADLNETEQKILIFKFMMDLTFEQIGANLQKSAGYVAGTYYRALEKLKNTKFK